MATTTQRELLAEIERLGYTFEGYGGGNDAILRHPVGGRIRVHATPSDVRYAKNKLSEARRKIRIETSKTGQFVTWLMERHGVERDDRKWLRISIPQAIEEYLSERGREAGTANTLTQTFVNDPRISQVKRSRGVQETEFVLTGQDYQEEPEGAEEPVQTPLREAEPALTDRSERSPMDVIVDQLRMMVAAEVGADVEDLKARQSLALDAVQEAQERLTQALEVLKEGRPHTGAESRPGAAAQQS